MRNPFKRLWERLTFVPDDEEAVILPEQDEEAQKLVEYINSEWERRKEERRPFELQWRLNQNFLTGNQYCDIDAVLGDVVDYEPPYEWMQAEVYNHLAPINMTRLAKLGRVQPGLSVRPATSDNADQAAAKMSTQLLKGFASALDLNRLIREAEAWNEVCGTVLIKTTWNPRAGRMLGMMAGQSGEKAVFEGDLMPVVVPAFEFYPDSVNHPEWPQPFVKAGQPYHSETKYIFK